ncbi:MAG TPA: hypothetical protein VGA55_02355 [Bacteroidota bacterium]
MTKSSIIPTVIQLPAGKIRNEQLIPFFQPDKPTGFFGLKSGKSHPHGLLVSLEKTLTAADLLKTFEGKHKLHVPKKQAQEILEKFLAALHALKPGNVIFIHYSKSGEFSIDKVAETPPVEQNRF